MRTSEDAELREKRAESEKLLSLHAEKERSLERLKISVAQFQLRYNGEISQKYIELKRLTAIFTQYDYNHKVTNIRSLSAEAIETQVVPYNAQESKEAKRLYRSIASVIHPDKAMEPGSQHLRTRLMAELNDAYQRKDIVRMQRLFDQWQESPEAVSGEGSAAELLRTNRLLAQIKKRLTAIEQELFRIKNSDIYRLMLKAQDADNAGRDILAELSTTINAKIQELQNKLLLRLYG